MTDNFLHNPTSLHLFTDNIHLRVHLRMDWQRNLLLPWRYCLFYKHKMYRFSTTQSLFHCCKPSIHVSHIHFAIIIIIISSLSLYPLHHDNKYSFIHKKVGSNYIMGMHMYSKQSCTEEWIFTLRMCLSVTKGCCIPDNSPPFLSLIFYLLFCFFF